MAELGATPILSLEELEARSRRRGAQIKRRRRLVAAVPAVCVAVIATAFATTGATHRAEHVHTVRGPTPPVQLPVPDDGHTPAIGGTGARAGASPQSPTTGEAQAVAPPALPAVGPPVLAPLVPGLRRGDRVAFSGVTAGQEAEGAIYVARGDGTGVVALTHNAGLSYEPAWSPDGRLIAFVSNRDRLVESVAVHKVYDVYVMNADGTDVRRLTTAAAGSRGSDSPTFSADGRRIVFATDFPDGARLFVINRDGTGLRALTRDGHLSPTFPTWSPDGRSIAFTSSQDGRTSIYVMEADGSRVRRLTGNGLDAHTVDDRPSWSPDSKRLVFDRYGADGIGHLVVMNADGTEQREVPTGPGVASEPSWTPDGHHLVFAWDADGRLVVDAGTDITQSHGGTKPSIIRVVGVDGGGLDDLVAVPGGVDDAATPEVAPRR